MEEKNLIIRQRDQSDRRILHLYPTDRGCLLYHLILKEENRNIALFWEGIPPEDQKIAERVLTSYTAKITSSRTSPHLVQRKDFHYES